ncbi:MAG: YqgE/AlgH family protein [Hyphomicrobiaceae bacterium]|nr:YqgE/AlgH family protein [Hyphomicrobiaceae bacterium]
MTDSKRHVEAADTSLQGQLLLAMPTMIDKRFHRAVIYMCRHSEDGAMGIIVNHRAKDLSFTGLLRQLDLVGDDVEETVPAALLDKAVHVGGPVSTERGFVLHSSDFVIDEATLKVSSGICLTATVDMLRAIAGGRGPRQSILALGYSGWAPGQLENEIQANGWLHCPADKDLVFSPDVDLTYDRALSKIGIDPAFLVSSAGHA